MLELTDEKMQQIDLEDRMAQFKLGRDATLQAREERRVELFDTT